MMKTHPINFCLEYSNDHDCDGLAEDAFVRSSVLIEDVPLKIFEIQEFGEPTTERFYIEWRESPKINRGKDSREPKSNEPKCAITIFVFKSSIHIIINMCFVSDVGIISFPNGYFLLL